MALSVRRVVTGQRTDGTSVFTHVEEVAPIDMGGGMSWYGVWGWEEMPILPHHDPETYQPRSTFPAPGGMRVNTVVFPPGYGVRAPGVKPEARPSPPEEYRRLSAAQSPGGQHDPATGMHSTNSIDFGFVVSGEICLEQEDGSEVALRPGDVYVQNGAVHAWRNRSSEPAAICFLLLGAERHEHP
jgi:hypothetical protein